jgi:hypothetical protein
MQTKHVTRERPIQINGTWNVNISLGLFLVMSVIPDKFDPYSKDSNTIFEWNYIIQAGHILRFIL